MKILKRILIVLLVLVGLILIIALFIDRDFHVSRSIVINKPKNEVFDYVRLLKNQDAFSVWNRMDPNMKKTYTGTDGTVGFVYAWDSKKDDVGAGEQEITAVSEGKRLDCDLRFKRPYESKAKVHLSTSGAANNSTRVEWAIEGSMAYPFNFMRVFWNMDEMMGKDLQQGLDNLKTELESKAAGEY